MANHCSKWWPKLLGGRYTCINIGTIL